MLGKFFYSWISIFGLRKNIDFSTDFLTDFFVLLFFYFFSRVFIGVVIYGCEFPGTSCRGHSRACPPLGEKFYEIAIASQTMLLIFHIFSIKNMILNWWFSRECLVDDQKKTFRHWHHLNYHIRGVQNAIREILSVLLIQVSDLLKPSHNDRPLKNRSQNGSQKSTLAASSVRLKCKNHQKTAGIHRRDIYLSF